MPNGRDLDLVPEIPAPPRIDPALYTYAMRREVPQYIPPEIPRPAPTSITEAVKSGLQAYWEQEGRIREAERQRLADFLRLQEEARTRQLFPYQVEAARYELEKAPLAREALELELEEKKKPLSAQEIALIKRYYDIDLDPKDIKTGRKLIESIPSLTIAREKALIDYNKWALKLGIPADKQADWAKDVEATRKFIEEPLVPSPEKVNVWNEFARKWGMAEIKNPNYFDILPEAQKSNPLEAIFNAIVGFVGVSKKTPKTPAPKPTPPLPEAQLPKVRGLE